MRSVVALLRRLILDHFGGLMTILPQNATSPDFARFPVAHDFVLNNRPHAFVRFPNGAIQLKRGTVVSTDMGIGYIERGLGDGSYAIRITHFDGSFEKTLKNGRTLNAESFVRLLSSSFNSGLFAKAEFFESQVKDKKYAGELLETLLDSDTFVMSLTSLSDYGGASVEDYMITLVQDEKKGTILSKLDRKERRRLRKLATQMIDDSDDLEIPSDIADELDAEFGAFEDDESSEDVDTEL